MFGVKTLRLCNLLRNVITSLHKDTKLLTTSGLPILLHDVISLSYTTSSDKYFKILNYIFLQETKSIGQTLVQIR